MKKILIVLLNVVIIFSVIGLNFNVSFASEGTIQVRTSVTAGTSYTVTVTVPQDAVFAQGTVDVKYADGTTQSSGIIVKGSIDLSVQDYPHPGHITATFTAPNVEGTATITVSGYKIADKNGNTLNTKKTLTQNITIVKAASSSSSTTNTTTTTPSTSTNTATTSSSTTTTTPSTTPTTATTNTTTTTNTSEPTWTNTGDIVYAAENVNVRSGWGTTYSAIGKLTKGTSVTRIAKGSNSWDKVSYNGQTGYVLSQYLISTNPNASSDTSTNTNTTDNNTVEEPKWTETGDKVYATTNMNVRSGWATTYSSIGGLKKGDSVTRIAVGSNGWDKIKYEGKTAYVLSRLLTTEEVEPDEEEEENTVSENTVDNTALNNTIVNMISNELDVYNQLIEDVGVLPAVGKNFADYVYIVSVCGAIAMIGFVGLKIREKNEE